MASYTPNYNLKKPVDGDPFDVADANGNMDLIDAALHSQNEAIANNEGAMAYIVGNTNTTGSTLAVGQFVYVKGHSTIAEGLRKVTASISANGSITTSNTTAVSGGGLNELNSKFINLGTMSGATMAEGVKAACLAYKALNFYDKPCPVRFAWGDNYIGVMCVTVNWVKFHFSSTDDIIYGDYHYNTDVLSLYSLNSNKAKNPIVMEITGTTSSSGALLIPTVVVSGTFLSAWGTNTAYFIYRRDNTYFMVRDTNLNVVSETEITIKVAYIPA